MNKSLRVDSLDKSQDTFTSFKGYQIDIYDDIWVLDINQKANMSNLSKFSEKVRSDVLNTFIHFAKYSSSTHATEMINYALKYPDLTGESEITVKGILEYKNYFNDKKYEYKLAKFRVFLKKLYDLGYASVDDEIYDLMDSWILGGNEKGAAVLSLDPDGSVNTDSTFTFQIATPRTLQELNVRTTLSMHTTEFGLCTHSYIDEPCLKYRNCLNCTEHVCIKGDAEKKKRLQDRLRKEKILWAKDKE